MPVALGGGVGLDAGILDEGGAGFLGLGQAQLAGGDEIEPERGQQLLEFASLPALWVASTSRSPRRNVSLSAIRERRRLLHRRVSSVMPFSASLIRLSSSSRLNGTCSAVPWISTNLPSRS